MLVEVLDEVLLALELPLQLLRVHVVGVALLALWFRGLHVLLRCLFLITVRLYCCLNN